ncbi:hypothetical protein PV327_011619, partial [Microctonus hyperodae]
DDGSPWYPKPSDLICSDHFIGSKKSDESASPSYVPTIFPSIYRAKISNESVAISRYRRFMERRKKTELSDPIPTNQPFIQSSETCHESKVAGGRKSDSQITMESGLIDYLEDGDIVLADKGFPEIRTVTDRSGKE